MIQRSNAKPHQMRIGHIRYINILAWVRGFRVKIAKFFVCLLSLNSQKRLVYKEHNTKYRSLTWKPRSHVRILTYWSWPIAFDTELKAAQRCKWSAKWIDSADTYVKKPQIVEKTILGPKMKPISSSWDRVLTNVGFKVLRREELNRRFTLKVFENITA